MKILITGHKGFVGSAVYNKLENDYDITGYDLPFDICDTVTISDYIRKSDIVLHIAAIADLYETAESMERNFNVNVKATYDMARLCAKYDKKLIYISTCCVYGNTGLSEETEEILPKTIEPYACSKFAAEYMLRGIPYLDYAILRIGTVYGPNMREALFNYRALDYICTNKEITINSDGKQTRQYIYIDDLVDGICLSVNNFDSINKETINLCGNENTSVLETIEVSEHITGIKAKVSFNKDGRYGEIKHENVSIKKAKDLLNWSPETTFFDGMCQTYLSDKRFINVKKIT